MVLPFQAGSHETAGEEKLLKGPGHTGLLNLPVLHDATAF